MFNHSDNPIEHPDEDKLGVSGIAEAIADCIDELDDPEGNVFAIRGKWGAGKSSVVKLVEYFLRSRTGTPSGRDNKPVNIIRFHCWHHRTPNAMAAGFCHELYSGLRTALGDSAHLLVQLGMHVSDLGQIAAPLLPPGVGMVGKVVESVKGKIVQYFELDDSGDTLKRKLAGKLEMSEERFLVIVDDLDRLTAAEVLTVLQLVKSVGRLPRTMYLLAFDHQVLEAALNKSFEDGSSYLDKIVQLPFDLPLPSRYELARLVRDRIQNLLNKENRVDVAERIDVMLYTIIVPNLYTPRDVFRILNALPALWSAAEQGLYAPDFLGIESIRLMYPSLYTAIQRNKQYFLGDSLDALIEQGKPLSQFLREATGDPASGENAGSIEYPLVLLFPHLRQYIEHQENFPNIGGRKSQELWVRQRRVCSKYHFDGYFRYGVSHTAAPRATVNRIICRFHEDGVVADTLLNCVNKVASGGRTQASYLLEELRSYVGNLSERDVSCLLVKLFANADVLPNRNDDLPGHPVELTNWERLMQLTEELVEQLDEKPRTQAVEYACEHSALGWLTYFSDSILRSYDDPKMEYNPDLGHQLVDREVAEKLVDMAKERLSMVVGDQTLLQEKQLRSILELYRSWSLPSRETVGEQIRMALRDHVEAIKLVRALLTHTVRMMREDIDIGSYEYIDEKLVDYFLGKEGSFCDALHDLRKSGELNETDQVLIERAISACCGKGMFLG